MKTRDQDTTNTLLVKLGDVCDVIGGGTPSKSNLDFWNGDILWASIRDMKRPIIEKTEFRITKNGLRNSSTNLIPKNNVIIATRVGLGKVCLLKYDTAINQDIRAIIPKDNTKLDKLFLFWWLRSTARHIEKAGVGATVKGVTLPFIKGLDIPLPSIEKQRQIVARLDAAFEKIEAAEILMQQNLDNATALQKSILYKYLNTSDITHPYKLGDVFTIGSSKRVLKSQWRKKGVPFYRGREITRLSTFGSVDNELYIDESLYQSHVTKYGVPQAGDIMITAIGTIGNSYVVLPEDKFYFKDASVLWLKRDKTVNSRYINYWINSPDFKIQLEPNGTTVNTLTIGKLQSLNLYLPSIESQNDIVATLDNTLGRTSELKNQYTKKLLRFDALRQALLQEAFSTTSAV